MIRSFMPSYSRSRSLTDINYSEEDHGFIKHTLSEPCCILICVQTVLYSKNFIPIQRVDRDAKNTQRYIDLIVMRRNQHANIRTQDTHT